MRISVPRVSEATANPTINYGMVGRRMLCPVPASELNIVSYFTFSSMEDPRGFGSTLARGWCLHDVCIPEGTERIEARVSRPRTCWSPDTDPQIGDDEERDINEHPAVAPVVYPPSVIQLRIVLLNPAGIGAMSRARYPSERWQPAKRPGALPLLPGGAHQAARRLAPRNSGHSGLAHPYPALSA